MAINLKKKQHIEVRKKEFADEDFADINLNNIMNNERIFIPYDELPDSDEQRSAYLECLVSFIERKTEKHCSYFLVSETEPYEVSGFYIQTAPELRDCHGNYIATDGYVYDRKDTKWHVSYYYKDNAPHIILDNEEGNYQIVKNLSEFSSVSAYLIPAPNDLQECNAADEDNLTMEIKKDCNKDINIRAVIVGVGCFLAVIVIAVIAIVLVSERFSDVINEFLSDIPKESANTPTGNDIDFTNSLKDILSLVKVFLPKILTISVVFTGFSFCFKMIKRLLNGDRF